MHPKDNELIEYAISNYKTGQKTGVEQLEIVDKHQEICQHCRMKIADYRMLASDFVFGSQQYSARGWLSLLQKLGLDSVQQQNSIYSKSYLTL
ncbi:MAG: hypothetical protein HWD86_07955 [Kangiellaceae bacterium]|nr:hypothetical protein [Kangiellaceae bacterium]